MERAKHQPQSDGQERAEYCPVAERKSPSLLTYIVHLGRNPIDSQQNRLCQRNTIQSPRENLAVRVKDS